MYTKCCVPGCLNTRQDAYLHKFPISEKKLKKWVDLINCDSLRRKSIAEVSHLQVCHRHFETRFVTKKRLLSNAYPTLFLESEIRRGTPLHSLEENPVVTDHSYAKKRHWDHTYCNEPTKETHTQVEPKNYDSQIPCLPQDIYEGHFADVEVPYSFEENQHHQQMTDIQMSDVEAPFSFAENQHHQQMTDIQMSDPQVMDSQNHVTKNPEVEKPVEKLAAKCTKVNKNKKSARLLKLRRRRMKARFAKEQWFEKKMAGLSSCARKIFDMQIKMSTKKRKGWRFTLDEKFIALSLLSQGLKTYRFLQTIFILPSITTLKKMVLNLNVNCGINPEIFEGIPMQEGEG